MSYEFLSSKSHEKRPFKTNIFTNSIFMNNSGYDLLYNRWTKRSCTPACWLKKTFFLFLNYTTYTNKWQKSILCIYLECISMKSPLSALMWTNTFCLLLQVLFKYKRREKVIWEWHQVNREECIGRLEVFQRMANFCQPYGKLLPKGW